MAMGLQERLYHTPAELSGGQKQRAAIARATVTQPKIILADEPTGALDSATGRLVLELFSQINRQGTTVIIVTHDPKIGCQAPRQISILDGRIQQDTGGLPGGGGFLGQNQIGGASKIPEEDLA